MRDLQILNEMILGQILSVRTALVCKVVRTDGKTADLQPLQMFQQEDGTYEKNPMLPDVPILQNVRKFKEETKQDSQGDSYQKLKTVPPEVGDIVFCLCADRDLEHTIDGKFDKPTRHHSISDAVVVGIF